VNTLPIQVVPALPTLKQVLWRSGCPPHKAGSDIEHSASYALDTLAELSGDAGNGVLLFDTAGRPSFLEGIWPERRITLLIATLGEKVDTLLAGPATLNRFMLDSAASVAVETYMKTLQAAVAEYLNMVPTKRIAPGYGDFPLSAQKEIIKLFPDSGVVCNESFMLTPIKSMTGVTGWIPQNN